MSKINIIQRQIPLGSEVLFTLHSGREISGILVEIGREHVTVERSGNPVTIIADMIGVWELTEHQDDARVEDIADLLANEGDSQEKDDAKAVTLQPQSAPLPLAEPLPSSSQATSNSNTDMSAEVLRMLIGIEARFDAKIESASIEVKPMDFLIASSEFLGNRRHDAEKIWTRAKEKFSYASRINETHPKFGRIQPITSELETLRGYYPQSCAVRRVLGYAYWLLGDLEKSLEQFRYSAIHSNDTHDWYNVAAASMQNTAKPLAAYALLQYYKSGASVIDDDIWYIFVHLVDTYQMHKRMSGWIMKPQTEYTEKESLLIRDATIYLLQRRKHKDDARNIVESALKDEQPLRLAQDGVSKVIISPSSEFLHVEREMQLLPKQDKKSEETPSQSQLLNGHIYKYLPDRNYGFLRDESETSYFFHRSAINDMDLLSKLARLSTGEKVQVVFTIAPSPRGSIAVGVSVNRSVQERFDLAIRSANEGDYPAAIANIRQVLAVKPDFSSAQELYESWRANVRITGVPKGTNPYARAKRVQLIDRDLDRAAKLFEQAIQQGDNVGSAVKDLASVYAQQGRHQDAIDILLKYRDRSSEPQKVNNMLVGFYQSSGQHEEAISLLKMKLGTLKTSTQRSPVLWQIGYGYMRLEEYSQAEKILSQLQNLDPSNVNVQTNIAICLFKQGQFEKAERLLRKVLDRSPDDQAARVLEAIGQAQATGQSSQIDIMIQSTLASFSSEVSRFVRFYLDQCDFKGVPTEVVQKGEFKRSHVHLLEDLATKLGTKVPLERAGYYLSAAKLTSMMSDEGEQSIEFYKYLCRAFASRGDAAVIVGRHPDVAREYYCEALASYDRYDTERSRRDEQDAVNALVRYLFLALGPTFVPMTPTIPSIDLAIEQIVMQHPHREVAFNAISYLVSRSRYAADRVLNRVFNKSTIQALAMEYLKSSGVTPKAPPKRLEDFVSLWNELVRKGIDELRSVQVEIRFLQSHMELTTAFLEDAIERLKGLLPRLSLDLDQQRTRHVVQLLEMDLDLCKQISFEEQERLCIQIAGRGKDVLREITDNPTKLSLEELYPVVQVVQSKTEAWLQDLYERSAPQVTLRLAVESYIPDSNQRFDVQIAVSNRLGSSPAESLELVIQEEADLFYVDLPEIMLNRSLRGGEQQILRVPIRVTENALNAQAFSLPLYAQYSTRSDRVAQTSVSNFSIRLYSEADFEEIENPYAAYAEGGVVDDPWMFYGRDELIDNVASAIQSSSSQSKCVVIFGQKRAGKSSILHHLKARLLSNSAILILDVGNIGSILDEHSSAPFLYQILKSILSKLMYAVEDGVDAGRPKLSVSFPSDHEFYEHPSPLILFKDVFDRFKRETAKNADWKNTRLVLLIDEFSYIYGQIVRGTLPEAFMKNWKALLQEGYFSAVLAGQDVMPKFKQQFPNEFGTTQDERVSYLRPEDALRLIDEPIRIGGLQGESRFREQAIDGILSLTAGSPFYVQIVCNRLVEYMNRKRARVITDADVDQVKNDLIYGVNALSLDKFDNLISSGDTSRDAIGDEDMIKVLTAIAMNSLVGSCSRSSIVCETHTHIDSILDDLVKREVIDRERGQYYRVRVGLFKEWLVAHQ